MTNLCILIVPPPLPYHSSHYFSTIMLPLFYHSLTLSPFTLSPFTLPPPSLFCRSHGTQPLSVFGAQTCWTETTSSVIGFSKPSPRCFASMLQTQSKLIINIFEMSFLFLVKGTSVTCFGALTIRLIIFFFVSFFCCFL